MSNRLRISLVIPVYNEESHLADCLHTVFSQIEPFQEVIVVDNNSSDATVAIATSFPGVTVLYEPRQGVVYGRNRGFEAASGDIIARIDADTHLPADWTQQITELFREDAVAALSGGISYYDIAAHQVVDAVDKRVRGWMARKMSNRMFLLGSNMAIRRAAWQKVSPLLCTTAGLHEDLDLAAHLSNIDARVIFAPQLLVGVSGRRVDTNIVDFVRYLRSLPQTYLAHSIPEARYMYPAAAIVLFHYLPLRILFRGYDDQLKTFRVSQLLALQQPQRVNPTLFVD